MAECGIVLALAVRLSGRSAGRDGYATAPGAPAFAGARSHACERGFTTSRRSAEHGFATSRRSAENGFATSRRSAENGFATSRRSAENGFTLIELLVALMIFAMLSTMGVLLLRGSVDTQAAVQTRLDALADVQRGIATLDADLSQAINRISRTQAGTLAPAFFGRQSQGDEPIVQFVRAGWSNPTNQRHPSLQKVEYWLRDGRFERIGYAAIDGAAPPDPALLFDKVTALAIRYRAQRGDWLDVWAPARPSDMPVAIELTLSRQGEPPLILRFLVGPMAGQLPRPAGAEGDDDGAAEDEGAVDGR